MCIKRDILKTPVTELVDPKKALDPRRVRVAFTNTKGVLFTPRGKERQAYNGGPVYQPGYIRVRVDGKGKIVSGDRLFAKNPTEYIFYAKGKNASIAENVKAA